VGGWGGWGGFNGRTHGGENVWGGKRGSQGHHKGPTLTPPNEKLQMGNLLEALPAVSEN
jgi:hypothetical protein